MIFNVHAGHCPDGLGANGAVGIVRESTEARNIKNRVIDILRGNGHTVYDCTDDTFGTESENLNKIISKCNAHAVDLDISIHLNASNGQGHGTEVLVYSNQSASVPYAQRICDSISALGYTNRGIKERSGLAVLRRTNSPSLLIETFFCDSEIDCNLYNTESMAQAICNGIIGDINISIPSCTTTNNNASSCTTQPEPEPQPEPSCTTQNTSCTAAQNTIDWNNVVKFCIAIGQQSANNFVGHDFIEADGIVGAQTRRMMVRVLQHALNLDYNAGLVEDGILGNATISALGNHYITLGETQYMVTAAEILMYIRGIDPNGLETPGTYGQGLQRASGKTTITSQDFLNYVS